LGVGCEVVGVSSVGAMGIGGETGGGIETGKGERGGEVGITAVGESEGSQARLNGSDLGYRSSGRR
jgi:hypothetical protein